jgi:error-prone DNA polymerase
MAAWKRKGGVDKFQDQLSTAWWPTATQEFAEAIFKQILGFGDYGFPESHAYSFALLVTVSSWLKNHEPACFLAAMLEFATDGLLQPFAAGAGRAPPRLNRVQGLGAQGVERLLAARAQAPFTSTEDLALRAELDGKDMAALAAADALMSLSGHRRQQMWDATAQRRAPGLLKGVPIHEQALLLPAASEGEEIVGDYAALRLTLRRHPLALLRPRLARMKLMSAAELREMATGQTVRACGIVKGRQRPGTANGTIFVTLEDETGNVNVIVWNHVIDAWREPLLKSHLLAVQGTWQRDDDSGGKVQHLVATGFKDLTPLMGRLAQSNTSRDFH